MLTTAPLQPHLARCDAGIAHIDLGRPEAGNILTRQHMGALVDALAAAGADPATHVVAIGAQGPAFCLGRDGKGEVPEALPWDARQKQMGATLDLYDAIAACPLPVVALVHGDAIGLGAALAGACDITLASDTAKFALPEIRHSIPATLAISALLHKLPAKALAHLVYSAETISAEEALGLGLVSKVYPHDQFAAGTAGYLAELSGRKRLVLETIKRYFGKARQLSPDMAAEYAGALMALVKPSLQG